MNSKVSLSSLIVPANALDITSDLELVQETSRSLVGIGDRTTGFPLGLGAGGIFGATWLECDDGRLDVIRIQSYAHRGECLFPLREG